MRFKLFKEKGDVISPNPIWVFMDNQGYLYTGHTIYHLLTTVIIEWKHDKHIAG